MEPSAEQEGGQEIHGGEGLCPPRRMEACTLVVDLPGIQIDIGFALIWCVCQNQEYFAPVRCVCQDHDGLAPVRPSGCLRLVNLILEVFHIQGWP
jgi:hypothetical protein